MSVILPASVVFGMGLYFNGARRYDGMDDKIRTVGILGQRDLLFEKIHAFEDAPPESFSSRMQSILTGAPPSSSIEVEGDHSVFSRQNYLWVRDREDSTPLAMHWLPGPPRNQLIRAPEANRYPKVSAGRPADQASFRE